MSAGKTTCEKCGEPAIVHITGSDAGPTRHLCLQCAAEEDVAPQRERVLNFVVILIVVGLFILFISVLADSLGFGDIEGFGWKQMIGLVLGVTLVLAGGLMRVPTITVVGLMITGITLLADWLGFGSSEGFGIQQVCGVLFGSALVVVGLTKAGRRTTDL